MEYPVTHVNLGFWFRIGIAIASVSESGFVQAATTDSDPDRGKMKALTRLPQICMWILLVLVLSEFAFIAYIWFSYCPPTAAARFAFSGVWFKEEFQYYRNAGFALDQPKVGKFFLWTSVMSCLACTRKCI